MKALLTIIRWLVGLLFIFSGLVKANDPLGLSYKMQEFFEAWGWMQFHDYTLAISVLMNAFEIIAGVALIVGWRMKLFSWLLLLLIVFFTFLTGYASLAQNPDGSPKFASCGCFGDCIPLDPEQSFYKDIILLVLILVIFIFRNKIKPAFSSGSFNFIVIIAAVFFSFGFQIYTYRNLPVVDCLPFKKGNHLLEQRKVPADAVLPKYELKFIYEKNGEKKEFDVSNLPDSTWKFADRKQVLISKGKNYEPKIKDFELKTIAGVDSTDAILSQASEYYFLFIKNFEGMRKTESWRTQILELAKTKRIWIVTGQGDVAAEFFKDVPGIPVSQILVCDVTAIKTAARAIPTLYKMKGDEVLNKWSWANFSKVD